MNTNSHSFNDTVNPMCACGKEVETTEHFLLRCHLYSTKRFELFEYLEKVEPAFFGLNTSDQVHFLLYGSQTNTLKNFNHDILKNVIIYLKATGRFEIPLILGQ